MLILYYRYGYISLRFCAIYYYWTHTISCTGLIDNMHAMDKIYERNATCNGNKQYIM